MLWLLGMSHGSKFLTPLCVVALTPAWCWITGVELLSFSQDMLDPRTHVCSVLLYVFQEPKNFFLPLLRNQPGSIPAFLSLVCSPAVSILLIRPGIFNMICRDFCDVVSKIHIYTQEEVEKMTSGLLISEDTQSCLDQSP